MSERRMHIRENVLLNAELSCPMLDKISAKILNISIGGVYIEANALPAPKVGEAVNITILVDIDGQDSHTFQSKVARIDDCGDDCGIALILRNVDMRYLIFLERIMQEKVEKLSVA